MLNKFNILYVSLIFQNKFFNRGLPIFSFFLFFYPLKLVPGFANVTSFKLKMITLLSTSTIPLNLFMEIIIFITRQIYYHSHYLFISFIPNLHYSLRPHYFDPMFYLFIFTGVCRQNRYHTIPMNTCFECGARMFFQRILASFNGFITK